MKTFSLSSFLDKVSTRIQRLRQLTDRLLNSDRANSPRGSTLPGPNYETTNFIKGTKCRHIAEIGIFEGYTSMEFARFLNGQGELHLFDYEDRVRRVTTALEQAGFRNVRGFGSSYKVLDSYNWSFAKLLSENTEPIYDYIFLDGAHSWAVDALTAFLADRMLKVGGYLDFDDYDWTFSESPTVNPKVFPLTRKFYTTEQIESKQVKMIVDLVIRRDPRYKEVVANKIFQKLT
jgi:predicted O-methyltransferase YrrM